MAMGFSRRRVHYAFRRAGSRIGRALSWLLDTDDGMHADDAELIAAGHSLRKHARRGCGDAASPHALSSSAPVVHGSSATSDEEHVAAVFCVTPPASPSGIVSPGFNYFAWRVPRLGEGAMPRPPASDTRLRLLRPLCSVQARARRIIFQGDVVRVRAVRRR